MLISAGNALKENNLFPGSENALLFNDTYELPFHCDFDLSQYPFDSQHCTIVVCLSFKINVTEKLDSDHVKCILRSAGAGPYVPISALHF